MDPAELTLLKKLTLATSIHWPPNALAYRRNRAGAAQAAPESTHLCFLLFACQLQCWNPLVNWHGVSGKRSACAEQCFGFALFALTRMGANVKHFFTSLGKKIFTLYGKEFFTLFGKQFFT